MRSITVFAFAFTYTIAVSGRITDRVPQLAVAIAVSSCLVAIVVFLTVTDQDRTESAHRIQPRTSVPDEV